MPKCPSRGALRLAVAAAIVLLSWCSAARADAAQAVAGRAEVLASSPVTIRPDPTLKPLATLAPGTVVNVRSVEDGWTLVEFHDERWGKRLGYIRSGSLRALPVDRGQPIEPPSRETAVGPSVADPTNESKHRPNREPNPRQPRARGSDGIYAHLGGGGTDSPDASGGALVAGITGRLGPAFVEINAVDLTMYPGSTYPYYRDYFDDGDSRCRNSLNGRFADDVNCIAVETSYAWSVAAFLKFGRLPIIGGAGWRESDEGGQIYGTAGALWQIGRLQASVRLNAGKDYVSGLGLLAVKITK